MNKKPLEIFIVFVFAIGCIQSGHAQSNEVNETIKTEAKILTIEEKRAGRKVKSFATIEFKTENGKKIMTQIEVFRIPFYGPFFKATDTITVHYEKSNPGIAYSQLGNIVQKYGMYLLIVLGVLIGGWRLMAAYKNKAT